MSIAKENLLQQLLQQLRYTTYGNFEKRLFVAPLPLFTCRQLSESERVATSHLKT